jgi:hypothetical protein
MPNNQSILSVLGKKRKWQGWDFLRPYQFFHPTEGKGPVVLESGMLYDADKNPNFCGVQNANYGTRSRNQNPLSGIHSICLCLSDLWEAVLHGG